MTISHKGGVYEHVAPNVIVHVFALNVSHYMLSLHEVLQYIRWYSFHTICSKGLNMRSSHVHLWRSTQTWVQLLWEELASLLPVLLIYIMIVKTMSSCTRQNQHKLWLICFHLQAFQGPLKNHEIQLNKSLSYFMAISSHSTF